MWGPWSERIYLAGGLAPRYLVGQLPHGAGAHVGTTDVDLIIGLALGDEAPETYRTLHSNLNNAGFKQVEPSFRWSRTVDGAGVYVEFLCETDRVAPGAIYRPREGTGSKVGAFNVRGAQLATRDYIERAIEGDQLDDGGRSTLTVRVAGLLTYTVLKIFAFQDRHENKDAYDLVFTIANYPGGPTAAGRASAASPIASHPKVNRGHRPPRRTLRHRRPRRTPRLRIVPGRPRRRRGQSPAPQRSRRSNRPVPRQPPRAGLDTDDGEHKPPSTRLDPLRCRSRVQPRAQISAQIARHTVTDSEAKLRRAWSLFDQRPDSLQWQVGAQFFAELVVVAEHGVEQVVGVPHPDAEELAAELVAGGLVDTAPGDEQRLVCAVRAEHAMRFSNDFHVHGRRAGLDLHDLRRRTCRVPMGPVRRRHSMPRYT